MALKRYQKAPYRIKIDKINEETAPELMGALPEQEIKMPDPEQSSTFVRMMLKNSKYVFPAITGLIGVVLLLSEAVPIGKQALTEKFTDRYDQEVIALADPKILGVEDIAISNPDSDYFKNLVSDIERKTVQTESPDTSFNQEFYVTIPSIGADNMRISPNVDSFDPNLYKPVLERTLAHFRGTCLPFQPCNSVIYGHSASGLIGTNSKYVFSKLADHVQVGDDVSVKIGDEDIKYKITRTKIVDPNDMSVLDTIHSRRSLTLITCYPNGSNSKRYIAIAEEV